MITPGAARRAAADTRRARRSEVDSVSVVIEAAAAILAVRPRSIEETRQRLRRLGYRDAPVEGALDRLAELGYLDDVAFARGWVESRDRSRPRGTLALRRELLLKGVARDAIDQALGGRPTEPDAVTADAVAAARLLARKAKSLNREHDPRRRRARAYALLARNGFDPDVCRQVSATVAVESVVSD